MLRVKGIVMIIIGAMLWGATGPMMEWILLNSEMRISFLIIVRLILAGVMLLLALKLTGKPVMIMFRQKIWLRQTVMFGIFGMLGVQLTFLGSIESSNAIIATLFQFMAPIYIIAFVSWRQRTLPPRAQVIGILVTMVGLFFLLTNGSLESFVLSKQAVLWGLSVGFAFAFYTLYPVRLMSEWGVLLPVGWGMLIGGIVMLIANLFTFPSGFHTLLDWRISVNLLLAILIGTLAFVLFLGSMKYITPIETSVLSSFEPLTAMVISVIWLGQVMGAWQLGGAFIMLLGVIGLSVAGSKVREEYEEENIE